MLPSDGRKLLLEKYGGDISDPMTEKGSWFWVGSASVAGVLMSGTKKRGVAHEMPCGGGSHTEIHHLHLYG